MKYIKISVWYNRQNMTVWCNFVDSCYKTGYYCVGTILGKTHRCEWGRVTRGWHIAKSLKEMVPHSTNTTYPTNSSHYFYPKVPNSKKE